MFQNNQTSSICNNSNILHDAGGVGKKGLSVHGKSEFTASNLENGDDGFDKEELPVDDTPPAIAALGLEDWRATEKKLVRTLDLTMMPMLWILYLFNYLDRTSIAQVHARLNTFEEDLGLVGTQFNTAVAVLTAGYVAAQIPSNMLMTRVRPGLYLPACAIVWSAVSACTAACTNFDQLVAVRILLGLVEAPLFLGALYLVSCWYKRSEIALRNMILYVANYLASACSGLIAAAVFATLDGALGIAGWKWLFIIEAAVGACFAVLAMFLLPNYPGQSTGSASWSMTEDMRRLSAARIVADRVSEAEATHTIWFGLRKAVTDYKLWVFVVMNLTISAAYGYNNFFPSIVRGLNLGGRTVTLLLTAPPYVLACCLGVIVCRSSDKRKDRTWHLLVPASISIAGYIICISTLNDAARYAASYFYISFLLAGNPLVITWAVQTLSSTPEKRAAGTAVVNVLGQIGVVMAPYFFRPQDEPRYVLAFILMMAMALIAMACAFGMRVILGRQNKKLRQMATENGTIYNPYTL